MFKKIGFLLVILVLTAVCNAAALDLKPGKYEITASVKMSGMPAGMAGALPSMTFTQCMTEQDPVPTKTSADSGECTVSEMKITDNSVTYAMECDQGGRKMKSKGSMTYHGNSFEGTVNMDMGASSGGMKMSTEIKGKRVGSCD